MADSPLLTVCVVTYNSEKHIGNVLSSLFNSTIASRMEVIVVDNASVDHTVEIVQESFPAVRLVKLRKNIGFGQGHNQALPFMNAPYHLIVNPDITFTPDTLEKMLSFMDSSREVVLLTPKVLHPDGSEQYLPKEQPSIRFLLGGYLERMGSPFTAWRSQYTWRGETVDEPKETSFATGCFMLLRADAFRAVGGFDPRYFLYIEDADLTIEMKTRGLVLYHPSFCVTHVWARESAHHFKGLLLHAKSIVQYFQKWGWRF